MPFIRTTTNAKLDDDREIRLREGLGRAVDRYLGKDPVRMMTVFEGGMHLQRGIGARMDIPAAFVECKFFGGDDLNSFEKFDEAVKDLYRKELSAAPEDLYIKYEVINGWESDSRIFKL